MEHILALVLLPYYYISYTYMLCYSIIIVNKFCTLLIMTIYL